MAELSVVLRYREAIRALLPKGKLFAFAPDSQGDRTIQAMSEEPARLEERGQKFLDEMDPRTTFEMLDTWERVLGLPDECTPTDFNLTIAQRRARVLQKFTTGGGQSAAFFKLIASQLGYDPDQIKIRNFRSFRVGKARVGDPLSNAYINGVKTFWPTTIQFVAPAAQVRRFRVGQSSVGERLVVPENATLECVVRRFAPAHVTVLFSFE